jgi:hypothetical protein
MKLEGLRSWGLFLTRNSVLSSFILIVQSLALLCFRVDRQQSLYPCDQLALCECIVSLDHP